MDKRFTAIIFTKLGLVKTFLNVVKPDCTNDNHSKAYKSSDLFD